MHETRRGTQKVLNNSQKEFILVYYPDNIVDEVSFMDFLYRQAKNHEDQVRWGKEETQRDAQAIRARTKTQKRKQRQSRPQYVQEIAHTNKETSMQPGGSGKFSFENLLNSKGDDSYTGPDAELAKLRQQINALQSTTRTYFDEMDTQSRQHSVRAPVSTTQSMAGITSVGYCVHCQGHLHNNPSEADEVEVKRQNILMQICEAKKRQAHMEAEEARRLRDEAKRLAEQANILELEAQRPLLEAQKLEQEARILEQQVSRLPTSGSYSSKSTAARGGGGSQAHELEDLYRQQRVLQMQKREQLLQESMRAQNEIKRLQTEAVDLHHRANAAPINMMNQREQVTKSMQPLYEALERPRSPPRAREPAKTVFIAGENSIAAKQARGEMPVKKMAVPVSNRPSSAAPEKKRGASQKSGHNYSYGEESDGGDGACKDPYLAAADKELEKARKVFADAQKAKEDA